MFDPSLGRWLTEDPIGFAAGDTNLYRFVTNNPVNLLDPSGLVETAPPPRPGKWSVKASDLLYQDPRLGANRGGNQKLGAAVATIGGRIDVDPTGKTYTLTVTMTSAVKEGTNIVTEWYLRDLFYSTPAGKAFQGTGFNAKKYPFQTTLVGEFVPKPLSSSIDFSAMKTEKDWEVTVEPGVVVAKKPASTVTAAYVFPLTDCDSRGVVSFS